ncbi:hypothetical protein [Kitasatospora purpeofusca]|uniref:hypothetical protein n=1 Tax=Kitasatospora purpeofusca TaxID=67352 RepID=UPI00142897BF|nr:hypothetical protein [Kitasatospora purpeofusca]
MSEPTTGAPEPEPIRIPEEDLDDLASALARTIAEVGQHGVLLDRLGTDPFGGEEPNPAEAEPEGPTALFILAIASGPTGPPPLSSTAGPAPSDGATAPPSPTSTPSWTPWSTRNRTPPP